MGRAFHIPSYQRGYRWTEVEVKALLDDLWEFAQREPSNNEFYCLQPIVLQENPDTGKTDLPGTSKADLLDGQQRLTTLYLILSFLEEKCQEKNYKKPLFSLSYATRQGSQGYLQKGRFREVGKETRSNVDYYHFAQAYKCIERWFKVAPAHPDAETKLLPILLNESGKGANVRLIEYKLEDDSKPIEVFLRLNQGKIPLTDAELVKALLLQADKYVKKDLALIQPQLDLIASEWYEVERALAQADRWAFIAPSSYRQSDTRIDLLLELVARRLELRGISAKEVFDHRERYKHPCYLVFALWLEQQEQDGVARIESVRRLWERIMSVYQYIEEWYDSHILYHYIGYLTNQGAEKLSNGVEKLNNLIQQAERLGRDDFEEYLRRAIGRLLSCEPSEMSYEGDKAEVRQLLLLHNVHLVIQAGYEQSRFPFSQHRDGEKGEWSLEHIRPQNPECPQTAAACYAWIEAYIPALERRGEDIPTLECGGKVTLVEALRNIQAQIDSRSKRELPAELAQCFEKCFAEILRLEGEYNPKGVHRLGNLCLLSTKMNSSLSNLGFDVKRNIIRKRSQERELSQEDYIPLATRMVFLKSFSAYPTTNYLWQESDAADYMASIERTYHFFTAVPTLQTEHHGRD